MRVLLQIRPNYRERPGGDAIQAIRTSEELRGLGADVELSGEIAPDLAAYDLVHIFNTAEIDDPVRQVIHARSWGKQIVLSPVYWDPDPYRVAISGAGAAEETAPIRATRALQELALGAASIWLPNSRAEGEQVKQKFPRLDKPIHVVPNAIDPIYGEGDGARFCARHGLAMRGFVLCIGRKEAKKNQLNLIAACRQLALPLVLVGAETEEAGGYVAECRALAADAPAPVIFLPYLDLSEIADGFAAARVHVQPSFYETVGLSTMEASLGGCNVVVTRNSGIDEYFGDDAWYCDPFDPAQIAAQIAAAWATPLRPEIGQALGERYTWRHVAEETLRGYEEVWKMAEPTQKYWLPDLPADEYITQLEETIQLQIEATAFRDRQHDDLQGAHRALYAEFQRLQGLYEEAQRSASGLSDGLAAEAAERQRTEAAFRALEAHVAEQREYVAKLERELAARPPAATSRWPRRSR